MKKLLLLFAAMFFGAVFGFAQNVTVNPGAGSYATLKAAFDAINAGTHTGAITVDIGGNTTETAPAVLNASGSGSANYTSITISPEGGAARTISGAIAAGSPLIDFNGADNVTIDGLNTGGNSLTISNTRVSTTSGTCTVRFFAGATNNTITNCTVLGAFNHTTITTNGGTIFFSTDAVTDFGNDNNTISNCSIGPVGTDLPVKAIYGNGSTTTTDKGNSGILIHNNDIYDFFLPNGTSAGIYINNGCNAWTITNNRFYQTSARTFTAASTHTPININGTTAPQGAQGFTITGNTIGYSANDQTGVYTMTGSTGKFIGIRYQGITGGALTVINNNTVASVSLTGVTSSGTSASSPLTGILIHNGLVTSNNNTIGSQSETGSLTFSTNTTLLTDVYGILNFGSDDWTANGNNIGGISVTNAAASGTFSIHGLRANTSVSKVFNASSNTVGGTVANSIQLSATGTSSQVIGIRATPASTWTSNTVRNLTTNIGTGTATTASLIGLLVTSTSIHTFSQNTIYNLSNTNTSAASVVNGIQFTGGATNVVERNLIYGLTVATNSAAAEVSGIRVAGGTTTYSNNVIALGEGIGNAIGAGAFNNSTTGINGIVGPAGTDNFFHNSVYIGGTATSGTGASYAFNGSTVLTNTRSFRNNIFFNARTNSGATGKHYAVKINGTAANPAGLTINNNVYFANGTGAVFGYFNSADVASLAAWQTAVGQDANSYESNPQYIAPTNAPPNLRPTTGSYIAGAGLGITTDYYGDSRSGTPDIGAYERGAAGFWIGITSADWATVTNWDDGALPTGADNVAIRNGAVNMPQVTQDQATPAVCNNLTINTGQSLTVNAGKALTVIGTLTNNGTLTVKSDASGTGSLIHNSAGVPATVERYFATAEKWRLVSSPVAQQAIAGDWTPGGNYEGLHGYDFYAYSEATATWLNQKQPANSIDNFITGKGYLVSFETAPRTPTFIDDLNNGNVVIAVTKTGTGDYAGANLVGNPYASGIDWNLVNRDLFDDNFAYVYNSQKNAGAGGYDEIDGSEVNAFIAPHQGFFVLKQTDGSSNFTFTNAMRAHGGTFTKQQQMQEALVLRLSGDTYYDQTTLRIHENAGFERDRQDARKFFSYNQQAPQLFSFTSNDIQVSINSIPAINEDATTRLGMRIPANGVYTISLTELSGVFGEQDVILEDTELGMQHNLSANLSYQFSAVAGELNSRFLIHFGALSINENSAQTAANAYIHGNILYILNAKGQTQLEVYDLHGRLLQSKRFMADGLYSQSIALPAGVYVVRLMDVEGVRTVKVSVK